MKPTASPVIYFVKFNCVYFAGRSYVRGNWRSIWTMYQDAAFRFKDREEAFSMAKDLDAKVVRLVDKKTWSLPVRQACRSEVNS
jgi:hypothetical protein